MNWALRELPEHHWFRFKYHALPYVAPGEQPKKWAGKFKKFLRRKDLTWFCIGSDSIRWSAAKKHIAAFIKRKRFLLIVDESDDFRTPGSSRTKVITQIARHKNCVARRIITGTVVTNSPLAAYSQFNLLEPGALGFNDYETFKRRYAKIELRKMRVGGRNRRFYQVSGYTRLRELRRRMSKWSSVVLREDVKDMPDLIKSEIFVEPSKEQIRAYRQIVKQSLIEIDQGMVSIGENTIRWLKLQQALSGFLVDEYGDFHILKGRNPKLEALSRELWLSPGKTVVWCRFRKDIELVRELLKKDGYRFVEYHGAVPKKKRHAAIQKFLEQPEIDVLLGQPQCGGRGVPMHSANHIIWYSHTFDAIIRNQANERATKIKGQNVLITDLVAPGSIEEFILDKVKTKESVAEYLTGYRMKKVLEEISI